jgi:hypothetical protein
VEVSPSAFFRQPRGSPSLRTTTTSTSCTDGKPYLYTIR